MKHFYRTNEYFSFIFVFIGLFFVLVTFFHTFPFCLR